MRKEDDRVKAAEALYRAIEAGDRDTLLSLYAENAVQIEHPNTLKPKGDCRATAKMVEDLGRGKKILRSEHYEVLQVVASGDNVAMQVKWTGVVAIEVGALKPGDSMICESAIFLRFEGDRIIEQHNYDCFEDFRTPRE